MASVNTYLNFAHQTEEAFNFYKSVFGGEFTAPGFRRFGDMPPMEGMPPISEKVKNLIMHVELPILGTSVLMGSDAPEQMGFTIKSGNNMHINLNPDSKEKAEQLFNALANEGEITMPLSEMFWGGYFGTVTDKFGIQWMFNYSNN